MKNADKNRLFEILAVAITGIGKFVFMDWLNWRFAFISIACVFWIGYVFKRYKKDKKILAYWGLSKNNFRKTFLELLPFAVLCVIAFILIGNKLETNILDWSIVPILLLYPIWGVIQQFIIVGLIAGNLKDLESIKLPKYIIVLATASLFAVVHYPFILLIAGTFFLAILYTILYLNNRNLIVLGIYHGWLGAFFFYTLLERNPWMEVFGMF